MSVGIDTAPRLLTIINVYIPQSARPEEEREAIFEELAGAVERASRKEMVVVGGDFNARLHGRLEAERLIIGPHVFGAGVHRIIRAARGYTERGNRELLMELCRRMELCVMNTWFRHGDAAKVTFAAPGCRELTRPGGRWDTEAFAELDFCLASNRWKTLSWTSAHTRGPGCRLITSRWNLR